MDKKLIITLLATAAMASCATHYEVTGVERSRILIDKTFDSEHDATAEAFIAPYKAKVDSIMSPVVGHVASYMWAERPESNLSNLLTDILIWAGKNYDEAPEFAVYNIGGMRAALSEGTVTYGNVLDVAPFENKICFFDLKGTSVKKLFEQIARNRGEGVSSAVRMVITKDGKLVSVKINGEDIDENRTYRVASIDYMAQGNDGLTAFKEKTRLNSPQDKSNNMRFIIMDYFREMEKQGKIVDSKVEGRITTLP